MKTAEADTSSLADDSDDDGDDGRGEKRISTPFFVKKMRPRRKSMPAPKLTVEKQKEEAKE